MNDNTTPTFTLPTEETVRTFILNGDTFTLKPMSAKSFFQFSAQASKIKEMRERLDADKLNADDVEEMQHALFDMAAKSITPHEEFMDIVGKARTVNGFKFEQFASRIIGMVQDMNNGDEVE